jgi:hypothetical protein
MVAQEIDRLNELLKDKSRLLNEEYLQSKQLSETIRHKDKELDELQKANTILQR